MTINITKDGEAFYKHVDEVGFEKALDDYTATGIAEGFIEAESVEQWLAAWQHLHDTGLAYRLQGWFGRTAQNLIDAGHITE